MPKNEEITVIEEKYMYGETSRYRVIKAKNTLAFHMKTLYSEEQIQNAIWSGITVHIISRKL